MTWVKSSVDMIKKSVSENKKGMLENSHSVSGPAI